MLNDQDIIRITDEQISSSKDFVNVFFYIIDVLVVGIELLDVLADFRDNVMDFVRGVQVAATTHVDLIGENLTNGIDIDTLITGSIGTDTGGGPVLPTYVAGGYRFNVLDKTTRPGGKRISGIGEIRVASNNYDPEATAEALLVGAFAAPFTVTGTPSGTGTATPIVVGRNILGQIDLARFSVVSSVTTASFIKSQVSRRRSG